MPGGIFQGVLAGAQEERMRRLDSIRLASQQSQMMHQRAVEALMTEKLLELAGHHHEQDTNAAARTTDTVNYHAAGENNAAGKLELGGGTLDVKKGALAETIRRHKWEEAHPKAPAGKGGKGDESAVETLQSLRDFARNIYDEMPKYKNMYGPGAKTRLHMQESLSGVSLPFVGNIGEKAFGPGAPMGAPAGWEKHQAGLENVLAKRAYEMGKARAVSTQGAREFFQNFHPDINKGYGYNRERMQELLGYIDTEMKYKGGARMGVPPAPGAGAPASKTSGPGVYSPDEAF